MKTYECLFCGRPNISKAARKRHNKKCDKNTAREFNAIDKESRIAAFECMADDLPDGAYFAMAEEFGLSPEDLI